MIDAYIKRMRLLALSALDAPEPMVLAQVEKLDESAALRGVPN
jgi:hypothetical protein